MLSRRIIPCLDMKAGRVVKGVNFRDLRDVADPVQAALKYQEEGADEIVFLDVAATVEGRKTLLDVVRRTAERLFIPLTVGGGVRSMGDVDRLLRSGADKVSLNTAVVQNPKMITEAAEMFGSQCVVIAIDAKKRNGGWEVMTHSGSRPSELEAIHWARRVEELGAGEILLTSVDADGTKHGYDLRLTKAAAEATHLPIIASGGCGSLEHIYEVLTRGQADAALAASIFHEGTHTVGEVKRYLTDRGIEVRMEEFDVRA